MLGALRRRWEAYKYRFVPWIAFNLRHKRRTLRFVPEESKDKIVSDEDVLQMLLKTFRSLFVNDLNRQMFLLNAIPEVKSKYPEIHSVQSTAISKALYNSQENQRALNPEEVLFNTLGFSITRQRSSLDSAGIGVFVAKGFVPEGTVVSMYPGTVYENHEPIFFQSIGNPFIFRCIDGVLIDGNNRGISKAIYSKSPTSKKWCVHPIHLPCVKAGLTKAGNLMKPNIELIAKWVRDAWEDIPEDMVQCAFLKCGISNAMDGSEDSALYETGSSDGDDCELSDDDNVYADNLTPAEAEALFGDTDEEEESSFEGF